MKEADTEHLFASVKETFGRAADVVFANAGILPANLPLAEENVRTWWSTLVSSNGIYKTCTRLVLINCRQEVNVLGTVELKELYPAPLQRCKIADVYQASTTLSYLGSGVSPIQSSPLARSSTSIPPWQV